ncbi:MAG: SDR family oxidoreductase [Armatimonadetes bacterium]|nr:SDR family oxidoreductase [Anaerolineae bacterium]
MTNYIVTGGAGFIGSHIAARLLADGHTVRLLDNLATGRRENLDRLLTAYPDTARFDYASITDRDALPALLAGAEVVYHQAALPSVPRSVANPAETHDHTLTGTLNVLVAAKDAGVRRVVYAASSSAYGDADSDGAKVESQAPQPISPYGVAKLAGEYYCQAFYRVYGLETVCLRYFNVFGPHQDPHSQYSAVIPLFITAMLAGKAPTIFGDGTQSRDFTYIDNVVYGNLLAGSAPDAPGEVLNLAMGGRVTLLELVAKLNLLLETQLTPNFAPPRPGDIQHSHADISKARERLDYAPVVNFDEGLARTVAYYRGAQAAQG